ncbi:hypothetical protein N7457_005897 [Penicillium paradoxum]|uniref:uncharacterized protein n=1 Tax=Penicillium paradoxum TaxID=176176 RepID=UPI0025488489|nr:uncharacterized protein N7457_005897 [Penicillium paradoxum]KAJ5780737.1 hypothetical protein N7457_005897 [Penicillium paradoxum]
MSLLLNLTISLLVALNCPPRFAIPAVLSAALFPALFVTLSTALFGALFTPLPAPMSAAMAAMKSVSVVDILAFLSSVKGILLGVLEVVITAKEVLRETKDVLAVTKEVITSLGELVTTVKGLFQWAQWALQWASLWASLWAFQWLQWLQFTQNLTRQWGNQPSLTDLPSPQWRLVIKLKSPESTIFINQPLLPF